MTDDEFEALVRRLEPRARSDPKGYRRRVALLAGLGYAAIGLALAVVLALGALVVLFALSGPALLFKFLIPIVAIGWIVAKSLAVKLDPPEGMPLSRDEAPALHAMIDGVNAVVGGPKVQHVLVDATVNAAVVQIPRLLGLLGQRNYLVLGLPLAQALSPDELRAVVAHELGHLSGSHGRLGAWVYRVRATWFRLLDALEERESWTTALFRRFFEWYVPYFAAYTFPLMRAHELEADDAAAEAAGAVPTATALVAITVADRFTNGDYWPSLYAGARETSAPPVAFTQLRDRLRGTRALESAQEWIGAELASEAGLDDTHPSLFERIRHLGLEPDDVVAASNGGPLGLSAAEEYLGPAEDVLIGRLDAEWRAAVEDDWREAFADAERRRARLAELEAQTASSLDELREQAMLAQDFRSDDEALALFRQVLERDRDDAGAHYTVGRILLERGDETGLGHLDRAMELDEDATIPASALASSYLEEHGRGDEAGAYLERIERHMALLVERGEIVSS
jgi:Zn-dependent protease with chaperone function